MPQTLKPTQTPSGTTSAPGSTTIPVPLADQVTVGSITPMAQAAINNAAYLAALLLGQQNAPPNAQPPALATTGLGSGPSRKQTLSPGPVSLASLPSLIATPLQVVNIPGVGEYVYISPYLVPAWQPGTYYPAGQLITSNSYIYQCTAAGTTVGNAGPDGPGWGINYAIGAPTWASITFAGGDGTDYVQGAAPSNWVANTAYVAGQYVLDPAHTSNIWLCVVAGTSGSGSGSPATPFTNATPTTGVSTQADGSGALLWASVAFVGQWISLNVLRKGFPANVLANVGTKTSEESFQPQVQGLVQTDQGGTIPLPYLPLTAAVWIGPGQPYYVGDRVCVPSSGGGGYLLVCIAPGYSGSSPPMGSQGTVVGEGSGAPTWIVIGHSLFGDFPLAKQLAYTEGGTTSTPGTIPPFLLPLNKAVSSSSGSFSTDATSPTDVTNCQVSLTTSGRPVVIACTSDDSADPYGCFQLLTTESAGQATGYARIGVTGSAIKQVAQVEMSGFVDSSVGTGILNYPPSLIWTLQSFGAGSYTFTLQISLDGDSVATAVAANGIKLIAYEL